MSCVFGHDWIQADVMYRPEDTRYVTSYHCLPALDIIIYACKNCDRIMAHVVKYAKDKS